MRMRFDELGEIPIGPPQPVVIERQPALGLPPQSVIQNLHATGFCQEILDAHPGAKGGADHSCSLGRPQLFCCACTPITTNPARREHYLHFGVRLQHFLKQLSVLEQDIAVGSTRDVGPDVGMPKHVLVVEHSIEIEIQHPCARRRMRIGAF